MGVCCLINKAQFFEGFSLAMPLGLADGLVFLNCDFGGVSLDA